MHLGHAEGTLRRILHEWLQRRQCPIRTSRFVIEDSRAPGGIKLTYDYRRKSGMCNAACALFEDSNPRITKLIGQRPRDYGGTSLIRPTEWSHVIQLTTGASTLSCQRSALSSPRC